jgi:hypothetical protein
MQGTVRWDLESVNTCPENYQWNQSTAVYIEAPGLYELTMAFFSKKKPPVICVYANTDLIYQT